MDEKIKKLEKIKALADEAIDLIKKGKETNWRTGDILAEDIEQECDSLFYMIFPKCSPSSYLNSSSDTVKS